jgi:hypothetical protein
VADLFSKIAFESKPMPTGEEAIVSMIEHHKHKLDQDALVGLMKVFALDENVVC